MIYWAIKNGKTLKKSLNIKLFFFFMLSWDFSSKKKREEETRKEKYLQLIWWYFFFLCKWTLVTWIKFQLPFFPSHFAVVYRLFSITANKHCVTCLLLFCDCKFVFRLVVVCLITWKLDFKGWLLEFTKISIASQFIKIRLFVWEFVSQKFISIYIDIFILLLFNECIVSFIKFK